MSRPRAPEMTRRQSAAMLEVSYVRLRQMEKDGQIQARTDAKGHGWYKTRDVELLKAKRDEKKRANGGVIPAGRPSGSKADRAARAAHHARQGFGFDGRMPGHIAAVAFESFGAGKTKIEVVTAHEIAPDLVDELYARFLKMMRESAIEMLTAPPCARCLETPARFCGGCVSERIRTMPAGELALHRNGIVRDERDARKRPL